MKTLRLIFLIAILATSLFAATPSPSDLPEHGRACRALYLALLPPAPPPIGPETLKRDFDSAWYRIGRMGFPPERSSALLTELLTAFTANKAKLIHEQNRAAFLQNVLGWGASAAEMREAKEALEGDPEALNFFAAQMAVFGEAYAQKHNRVVARNYVVTHISAPTEWNYDPKTGESKLAVDVKAKPVKTREYGEAERKSGPKAPRQPRKSRVFARPDSAWKERYAYRKKKLGAIGIRIVEEFRGIKFNGEYFENEGGPWWEHHQGTPEPYMFEMHCARTLSRRGRFLGLGDRGVKKALAPDVDPGSVAGADYLILRGPPEAPEEVLDVWEAKYFYDTSDLWILRKAVHQLKSTLELLDRPRPGEAKDSPKHKVGFAGIIVNDIEFKAEDLHPFEMDLEPYSDPNLPGSKLFHLKKWNREKRKFEMELVKVNGVDQPVTVRVITDLQLQTPDFPIDP